MNLLECVRSPCSLHRIGASLSSRLLLGLLQGKLLSSAAIVLLPSVLAAVVA